MKLKLSAYGQSLQGTRRDQNQDAWHANTNEGVFIVLDGMGGHKGGAKASSVALGVLADVMRQEPIGTLANEVRRAFTLADSAVAREAEENPAFSSMGTTATMLVLTQEMAHVGHLGDSRAYRLRDSEFRQLTVDHTLGAAIDAPPGNHLHNQLYAALGRAGDSNVDALAFAEPHAVGDRYLLVSDGVSNVLEDQTLQRFLAEAKTPEEAYHRIMDELEGVATDDHTAVVVFVD